MLIPEGVRAGKITKPYGLRGDVQIILESRAGNHIEPENPLFIDLNGQRVPFFVEEVELVSQDQAIVKFEFVDSLEAARELSGCPVYFDPRQAPNEPDSEEDLSDLVGYTVTDQELGPLGKITEYHPNPMNPLFIIRSENKELMVPAVRDFILTIDHGEQSIEFILPEGIGSL
jgi:16S rRNA processing protein RimM